MSSRCGSQDLIEKCLHAYGEWSYAEVLIANSLARDGDSLWDIGAYIGTFALGMARNTKFSRILAVDANHHVAEILENNIRLNIDVPFFCLTSGVAARAGMGRLTHLDETNQGNSVFNIVKGIDGSNGPLIPACTLKDLRLNHGEYNFLKLDIEGMEVEAVRGDLEYIEQKKPVIWAECNEDPRCLELFDELNSLGYTTVYVAFPAIRTDNYLKNSDRLFPLAYEAALVCATPNRLASFSTTAVNDPCIVRPINCREDLLQALWDTPRWALTDWVQLSKPELIARIGRLVRKEDFSTFLAPGSSLISEPKDDLPLVAQQSSHQVSEVAGNDPEIFETKMFWRADESDVDGNYSETRSNSQSHHADGRRQVINLVFPVGTSPINRLRFDVLDAPGVVDVYDLCLLDPLGFEIWRWRGDFELLQNRVQLDLLPDTSPGVLCTIVSLGNDPQFELNLSEGIYAAIKPGCVFMIELTAYRLMDRLPFIFECFSQRVDRPLRNREEYHATTARGNNLVEFDLAGSLDNLKELVRVTLDQRDKVIAQQNIQLTRFRDELTRAEAQLDLLKDLMLGGREEDRL